MTYYIPNELCTQSNSVNVMNYEKTNAIPIKNSSNKEFYGLKCSNFDPTKHSPPNHWNVRLEYRVNNYLSSKNNNKKFTE